MRFISAIVFALVAIVSTAANADTWKAVRVAGPAWLYTSETSKTVLSAGEELPAGASIVTGRGARVLLQSNKQTVIVGPLTSMAISQTPGAGLKTTVLQSAGTIEVEVEKRDVRYFSVETPLLAAVVKGTRFTVTVSKSKAQVAVKRGKVEVADFASGKIGNVTAGQKAITSPNGFTVEGEGTIEPIIQGEARKPIVEIVPAATIEQASVPPDAKKRRDKHNNGKHGHGNNGKGNNGKGNNGKGNNGNHGHGNNGNNGNHGHGNNGGGDDD